MNDSKRSKQGVGKGVLCLLLIVGFLVESSAYPSPPEDDRILDRDYASPGGHQLASWLISQMRKNDMPQEPAVPLIPYRFSVAGKRNSELTSSMMGIPRTMIDNGR